MVPTVERLVRDLGRVGKLSLNVMPDGASWWVSLAPENCGALWWYGCRPELVDALLECHTKAAEFGFFKKPQAQAELSSVPGQPSCEPAGVPAETQAVSGDSEESLCEALRVYCAEQGLPLGSADDLAASEDVSPEQRAWLLAFGERWDRLFERG